MVNFYSPGAPEDQEKTANLLQVSSFNEGSPEEWLFAKKNITIVEQPGVEAVFTSKGKVLTIRLMEKVFDNIKQNITTENIPHEMIEVLEEADISEIFDISLVN